MLSRWSCLLLIWGYVLASGATPERVSTGVLAISQNPENRIPPVALPDETFTSYTLEPGVRITVHREDMPGTTGPVHVVLYLLPNGNTTEMACGRTSTTEVNWRYGIQQIAAQSRRARRLLAPRPMITVMVEADTLSWPAWRKAVEGADSMIGEMVREIRIREGGDNATVDLVAHSGGGSFIWGFLNSAEAIPDYVEHIVILDANYSYADEDRHGDKFLAWLKASPLHRLVVLAYDDRRIVIDGKPIVSETGGTWRATDRMARRFEKDLKFTGGQLNDLQTSTALEGRLVLARHSNPDDKILHTVLVEKNGFVYGVVEGRAPLSIEDQPYGSAPGKKENGEAYREWVLP